MIVMNPDRVKASIDWIPTLDRWPDADTTVLLSISGGDDPVWFGFHDGKEWLDVCTGGAIYGHVTHWAEFPNGVEP
jgi:hypothetical protein